MLKVTRSLEFSLLECERTDQPFPFWGRGHLTGSTQAGSPAPHTRLSRRSQTSKSILPSSNFSRIFKVARSNHLRPLIQLDFLDRYERRKGLSSWRRVWTNCLSGLSARSPFTVTVSQLSIADSISPVEKNASQGICDHTMS